MIAPTVKPIVDLDQVARLLRRAEAHHDQIGWLEQPQPIVYVAYDRGDVTVAHHIERVMRIMGEPIRTTRYSAQPLIASRMFERAFLAAELQPAAALYRFAINVSYATPEAVAADPDVSLTAEHFTLFRQLLQEPGVLGFIYHCETFAVMGATPEALRAAGGIRNHPDVQENRIVHMVDTLDRVHHVNRVRGGTAELNLNADLDGQITASLRMMADATMQRLPADPESFARRYDSPGYELGEPS